MCELTNRSRLGIQEQGLKETEATAEHFRQGAARWTVCGNWCFISIKAFKPIAVGAHTCK